jgi:hypothetical protein
MSMFYDFNRSIRTNISIVNRYLLLASLTLVLLGGCGEETTAYSSEPKVMVDMMSTFGRGDMSTNDLMAGTDGNGENNGIEKTYLSYTRLLINGADVRGDLIVFDPQQGTEMILNQDVSRDEMDCISRGCTLHPDLTWVGWLQKDNNKNSLWLAPIDTANRSVDIANKRLLSNDAFRFEFTQDMIIYTELKDPSALNGTSVKYEPLDGSADALEFALVNSSGGFSGTILGDLFIIIQTTLSTMSISFYEVANERTVNLYTFGEAQQTGSEFSATQNPVILAPDHSFLVAITNNELMWRVHRMAVEDAIVEPTTRDLFPVRNAPERCQGEYAFTQVLGLPHFTKDSQSFYILFSGDCSGGNRVDYEIYRFSSDVNAEPVNITQLPPVNHWSKHDIASFDLNPSEDQIAFVATRPNQQGVKSIWVMNIASDGGKPDFDCSRSDGARDLEGLLRCEYIWYDGEEGTANYKSLQYHQTGAF